MTEQELIQQCRAGDREAQHRLYVRTAERIYRLHLRMTGNAQDASDLSQETWLKAFTRIHRFDGRASVETWLYRIAVNEALQFFRKVRGRRLHEQTAGLSACVPVCVRACLRACRTHRQAARTGRPHAQTGRVNTEASNDHHHIVALDVQNGLAALDPGDRMMLLLRYHEGLDYRTIAELTNVAEGTVASRLNRARNRLREHLRDGYAPAEESTPPAPLKNEPAEYGGLAPEVPAPLRPAPE